MVVIMTMTFYGLKMHPYMKLIQMKRIIKLWINTSHVMFHYYQLYCKMYNNINTLKKKYFLKMLFVHLYIQLSIISHENDKNITSIGIIFFKKKNDLQQ